MLPLVKTEKIDLASYKKIVSDDVFSDIVTLSEQLKGLKVFHVNSTSKGGGVAEILKTLVPLMKGIGIDAEWFVIPPEKSFFEITKKIHNNLQGDSFNISSEEQEKYFSYIKNVSELTKDMKPDVWIIHDFQPAGLALYSDFSCPSILRIHVDLTNPNSETWSFLSGVANSYNKVILSSDDFIQEELRDKSVIISPAIDPLSTKNTLIPISDAFKMLERFKINPSKPVISQISRFDNWKDPMGVISAYRIAKKEIKDLQLVLVGFIVAQDDPEADKIYKEVLEEADGDPDIFIFGDVSVLEGVEIETFTSAVQAVSSVVLQKSKREGFGLTVSEAMWKEKPVIAGDVGGIKTQIIDGFNGFLVSSPEEAAKKIVDLVSNPDLSATIGENAKKTVSEKFLMPRLLRDYLKLIKDEL